MADLLVDGDPAADIADEGSGTIPGSPQPDEGRMSPLGAYLLELEAELFPEHRKFYPDPMAVREEMTRDCMTEQGFRYQVVDWAAKRAELRSAFPSPTDEEIMAARGYGVADSLSAPKVFEYRYVDPNEAIKAALSDGERQAWEGQYRECVHLAQDEYLRPTVITLALEDELIELQERIGADPRVAAASASWSDCMANQGHSYRNRDEIFAYLERIALPLQDRLREAGGHDHTDAAFQADLDALMAIEAEIAVADLACDQRLDQVLYEVTVEHEQRFLDENQDRLALLRDQLPSMTLPGHH